MSRMSSAGCMDACLSPPHTSDSKSPSASPASSRPSSGPLSSSSASWPTNYTNTKTAIHSPLSTSPPSNSSQIAHKLRARVYGTKATTNGEDRQPRNPNLQNCSCFWTNYKWNPGWVNANSAYLESFRPHKRYFNTSISCLTFLACAN